MEFRLSRDDLLSELTLLQGIVERRTTIPILSHLLVEATDDGVELSATDLDVSLATRCPADVQRPGAIAVQAKKFTEIVRALGAQEMAIGIDGNDVTIESGRSRFRIRALDAENFPTLPTVDGPVTVDVSLAVLQRMIGKVLFAISTEESRFQLNGALFLVKADGLEMVATDSHRLALVNVPAADGEVEINEAEAGVLVPRKALQELARFDGAGTVGYRRSEHHLSFRLGNRELTCRILEGNFPDYERVIAKDNDKRPVLPRDPFQNAVSRVSLLTGERSRGVLLTFEPEQLVISAANPDLGEAVEQLPCDYSGEEVKVGLNPDYLLNFLAAVDSERVRLELKDAESQCVGFPEIDGEAMSYLCVIMPMHV